MVQSTHASSTYDEAHRFADTPFPRDLWDLGQADLRKITETFRTLASEFKAVLRLNPSSKHPHPGRCLVKHIGKAEVRIELALTGANQSFPDRLEEFRYTLYVFRTPRQGPFQRLFQQLFHPHLPDPTEWRVIGVYPPAVVRDAELPLREALANTARAVLRPSPV